MATRLSISISAGADPRTQSQRLVLPPGIGLARYLKKLHHKVNRIVDDFPRRSRSAEAVDEDIGFVREQYLPFLEFDVAKHLTPRMAEYGKVKEALLRLRNPQNKLPKDVAKKADELYKKFDAMGWQALLPTSSSVRAARRTSTGRYPPRDHPIWGEHGIMHGVIMEHGQNGRPVYFLDDRLTPREAKVYGHNDLQPGRWFPRQESLRFHGGHAQSIRGISGHEDTGAYSIVVSGAYEDTNRDEGDIVYYSAEGAHDRDPSRKANVKGNRALRASITSRNPVRVFRSAKGDSRFAPPCGIRYDGLYRVVGKEYRHNAEGKLYELFKLRRLQDVGQPDLEEIARSSPTSQEQADFTQIGLGY